MSDKMRFLTQAEVDGILRKINMQIYVAGLSDNEENDVLLHLLPDEVRGISYMWSLNRRGHC